MLGLAVRGQFAKTFLGSDGPQRSKVVVGSLAGIGNDGCSWQKWDLGFRAGELIGLRQMVFEKDRGWDKGLRGVVGS